MKDTKAKTSTCFTSEETELQQTFIEILSRLAHVFQELTRVQVTAKEPNLHDANEEGAQCAMPSGGNSAQPEDVSKASRGTGTSAEAYTDVEKWRFRGRGVIFQREGGA